MRFLADENFPKAAVAALEAAGHDIVWVRYVAAGAADAEVLAKAMAESRILLTFDKDFGELAARSALPSDCGILLFRIAPPRSGPAGRHLALRIGARDDWSGHFSVVEPNRVRMRPLRAP